MTEKNNLKNYEKSCRIRREDFFETTKNISDLAIQLMTRTQIPHHGILTLTEALNLIILYMEKCYTHPEDDIESFIKNTLRKSLSLDKKLNKYLQKI